MTAPLTPPSPNDDPWQGPPPGSDPAADAVPTASPDWREDLRADARDGVVVALAVTALGVAMGLLWLWLAPRVPLISDGKAVFLKNTEGEAAAGADAVFALLGLAFGALSAIAVFCLRRRGGIVAVVALALGGILGSILAWRLGVWLGPPSDVAAHARAVGGGVTFDAPLKLGAKGMLLAWPLAAMLIHLGLTSLFTPRDPDPTPDWGPPTP